MENNITVRVGDKTLTFREYKLKEIKRVIPIGFVLGAVIGYAFAQSNKRSKLKYSLLSAAAGVIVSAISLQSKFNKIGK